MKEDLIVMNNYEQLLEIQELYNLLEQGLDDVKNGRVTSLEEAFKEVDALLNE